MEERRRRGPMSADPQFRTVWAPDEFPDSTRGPVRFVPVTRRGIVVGYAWAAVTNDAAGFIPRAAAGGDGFNTHVAWVARLRSVKADGLLPLEALTGWAGAPEDELAGHVASSAEAEVATLDDLADIAAK